MYDKTAKFKSLIVLDFQQIKKIKTAVDCQWFCSEYYPGNCTWWMYDETTKYCKIFNEPQEMLYDNCFELGFSSYPPLSECLSIVDPINNTDCQVNMFDV